MTTTKLFYYILRLDQYALIPSFVVNHEILWLKNREKWRDKERERATKETWWQNEKVQAAIRIKKRERYRSLPRCRDNAAYEN